MSGLNIKLADLQISDFHAPECCFLWWHSEKTFSFWGRCPQTPTRGFAPWPHWGPTAAPRPPHHFPPFSLFPSPMSDMQIIAFTWLANIPSHIFHHHYKSAHMQIIAFTWLANIPSHIFHHHYKSAHMQIIAFTWLASIPLHNFTTTPTLAQLPHICRFRCLFPAKALWGLQCYSHWCQIRVIPFSADRPSGDGPQNRLSQCLWAVHWHLASFLNFPSLIFQAVDREGLNSKLYVSQV